MTEGLEERVIILTTREGHTLIASVGPFTSICNEYNQTTQRLGRFKESLERFNQWYGSLTALERERRTPIYDKGRAKIIGAIQATAVERSTVRKQLRGHNWAKT
ncbi:MAG: hypothetical protein M1607_02605 [Patescibacteria group bacterium]|nr:hypothetical protein [Patescibacteria group bacterium]